MKNAKILRFYLDNDLRQSALAGQHNFINKVGKVAENAGFRVEFRKNSLEEREKSASRNGYSMFHMDDPIHDRALTMRRNYYYPFWHIENTAKRWEWASARRNFEFAETDRIEARRFYGFWQKRLFGGAHEIVGQGGFVYVPLQGRLLEHRSFQSCSPFEMLKTTLRLETKRKVIATLHPNEIYTSQEQAALESLVAQNPRLSLEFGQMEQLLTHCDYVVSQNSSAAFAGYFFEKPCILFAKIDFHHIAANVPSLGAEQAFATVLQESHDFEGYVWWFLQKMSINAGRPDADEKILQRFESAGWLT